MPGRGIAKRAAEAALVLGAVAAAPIPAPAHPHVFIDGGVDFRFDETGRLSAIRVIWIYDAFTSLFMLEQLGLDADGDGELTEEDRAAIVADQTVWPEGYEGDSYLLVASEKVALGEPIEAEAALVDGKVEVQFTRPLAEPLAADGLRAVAKLYDPTYFFAYFVTEPATLHDAPDGCRAKVDPFEPSTDLIGLQQTLAELSREETPEQEDVGALFADRVTLTCG